MARDHRPYPRRAKHDLRGSDAGRRVLHRHVPAQLRALFHAPVPPGLRARAGPLPGARRRHPNHQDCRQGPLGRPPAHPHHLVRAVRGSAADRPGGRLRPLAARHDAVQRRRRDDPAKDPRCRGAVSSFRGERAGFAVGHGRSVPHAVRGGVGVAPPTRRALVLLGAGLAFMAGQAFGRFALTLILPDMRAGLGMSYADLGLIAGAAFGAYLLCAAPAGAASARFGPRRVVSSCLALSAVALAVTGLAPSFPLALAAQALNGAVGAGIVVPVLGLGPSWFGPRSRARATGVVVAGGGVGLAISGVLIPAALRAGGGDGWRLAWFSLALGLLATAGLATVLLGDPPRPPGTPARRPGLRAIYRSPAVWSIGLIFGCYGMAFAVYGT